MKEQQEGPSIQVYKPNCAVTTLDRIVTQPSQEEAQT